MVRRSYRPEKIINKLREVEVFVSQGSRVFVLFHKYFLLPYLTNILFK